jgi:hypothetical protein
MNWTPFNLSRTWAPAVSAWFLDEEFATERRVAGARAVQHSAEPTMTRTRTHRRPTLVARSGRSAQGTSHAQLAAMRLRNQRLVAPHCAAAEDVVAWLGAVQAQDYAGAKWAVAQRMRRGSDAAVEAALQSGALLRTHVLRPTWHFVRPRDLRAWLKLSAPRVHAAMAGPNRQLALDAATFARSDALLAKALQGGQRTRSELARALERGGIVTEDGVRMAHLLMHAELEAVICSGARRGKQFTYAAFDERVPKAAPPSREQALAELTLRYFQSHGPALAQDYAWWSGLTLGEARAGIALIAAQLEEIAVAGKTYFCTRGRTKSTGDTTLHLLPNFDEHIVAYKDRHASFDPRIAASRSQALASPGIVLNGQLIGGWRRTLERDAVCIEAKPLVPLTRAERAQLREAGDDYGRFLGVSVRYR